MLQLITLAGSLFLLAANANASVTSSSLNDSWAQHQMKLLTRGCAVKTSQDWLGSYLRVEDSVLEKIKNTDESEFEGEAKALSFASFVESVYPQDLPDAVDLRGAFLACFVAYSDFAEAKSKGVQKEKLKIWGNCLKYQAGAPSFQRELSKCILRLRVD